ncbi:DUF2007 domain-containing protein [Peptoniphilus equinus]|uniref:DUF2007 domain-containing protein n=1 Tax=Peptoniphilus equinus TaxID=3016343 RepID=A0ABY7QRW9_9FIRM|nr:DUF2007 domain-containing protein [Peptoniphilus equinus]WBW49524.1 DUF2007 domain-containing protein [Peptoniphilus equinus]
MKDKQFSQLVTVFDKLKLAGVTAILEDNGIAHIEEGDQVKDSMSFLYYDNVFMGVTIYVETARLDEAKDLMALIGELPARDDNTNL